MSEISELRDGLERYPYRSSPVRGLGRYGAALCAVVFLLLAVVVTRQNLQEGNGLGAFLAANLLGIMTMLSLGVMPQPRPRGHFRYISSIVMTRAERPTADSWVHLAPTRPLRLPFLIGMVWATLALLAAAVFAGLQVFGAIPQVNTDVSSAGPALAMVFMLGLGAIGAWLCWLLVWRRVRGGSFGRRPSGVALGESSVAVRVPGRDAEILWTDIVSVQPQTTQAGRRGQQITMIRLALGPGRRERVQMLSAEGYTVPTDALYTALRWYHARPEARWELGRVEGERRIEAWRLAALEMR